MSDSFAAYEEDMVQAALNSEYRKYWHASERGYVDSALAIASKHGGIPILLKDIEWWIQVATGVAPRAEEYLNLDPLRVVELLREEVEDKWGRG